MFYRKLCRLAACPAEAGERGRIGAACQAVLPLCFFPQRALGLVREGKKCCLLLLLGVCSFLSAVKETMAWFTYPAGIAAVADELHPFNPYPK